MNTRPASESKMPLHAMNPTGRFSDRAEDYARYRPSYPSATIDAVLAGLGQPRSLVAADVGAGTGISSRLLADRGVSVVAIEPNEAMRTAAHPHAGVRWQAGTAESTGLDGGSVDLILVAQAFHWVRQEEALVEFARVLKPRGRIALVWNERDRADAFMTEYRDAIAAAGGEHPAEARQFDPGVIAGSGLFESPTLWESPNTQRLDEAGLIGRVLSASYAPKDGPRADELRRRLRTAFANFRDDDGLVTLRYIVRLWVSHRMD